MAVTQSLTLTQESQSISNNSSVVKMKWTSTQSGPSKNGYTRTAHYYVSINGGAEQTYSVSYTLPQYTTKTIAEVSITVPHKDDGTGSISVRTWMDTNISAGVVTKSASLTLDTIPRKSSLSVSDGTLNTQQTISVTRKHSSFTHSIKAECGSSTLYIKEDGTTSSTEVKHNDCSIPWTPPIGWAAQAPNDNSVSVTFTITTYNGNTNIGSTPVTRSYAIPDDDSFKPSIVPTITDATGYDQLLGGWVQGHSRVQVDVEAYGVYGSTIKSIKTEFEGNTYTGASIATNAIAGYDVLPIKITVTDTRERSRTIEPEIFVQRYSFPRVTKFTAKRCDEDGTLNASGDHIRVSFGAEITSLNNNNTARYYVGYKKISAASHTAVELTELSGQYSVDSSYIVPADTASSYTIIFNASDSIKTDGTRLTIDGPTAKQVWSLMKKNGDIVGIAINKVAEHEGYFDVGMPVMFSGGGDTVVEQGEKNGWIYRKWESGVMECWTKVSHTTKLNTSWGGMYVGNPSLPRQSYPFPFVSPPVETVTVQTGWYMGMPYADINGNGTNGTYATAIYNIASLSQVNDNITVYFSISAVGRWK